MEKVKLTTDSRRGDHRSEFKDPSSNSVRQSTSNIDIWPGSSSTSSLASHLSQSLPSLYPVATVKAVQAHLQALGHYDIPRDFLHSIVRSLNDAADDISFGNSAWLDMAYLLDTSTCSTISSLNTFEKKNTFISPPSNETQDFTHNRKVYAPQSNMKKHVDDSPLAIHPANQKLSRKAFIIRSPEKKETMSTCASSPTSPKPSLPSFVMNPSTLLKSSTTPSTNPLSSPDPVFKTEHTNLSTSTSLDESTMKHSQIAEYLFNLGYDKNQVSDDILEQLVEALNDISLSDLEENEYMDVESSIGLDSDEEGLEIDTVNRPESNLSRNSLNIISNLSETKDIATSYSSINNSIRSDPEDLAETKPEMHSSHTQTDSFYIDSISSIQQPPSLQELPQELELTSVSTGSTPSSLSPNSLCLSTDPPSHSDSSSHKENFRTNMLSHSHSLTQLPVDNSVSSIFDESSIPVMGSMINDFQPDISGILDTTSVSSSGFFPSTSTLDSLVQAPSTPSEIVQVFPSPLTTTRTPSSLLPQKVIKAGSRNLPQKHNSENATYSKQSLSTFNSPRVNLKSPTSRHPHTEGAMKSRSECPSSPHRSRLYSNLSITNSGCTIFQLLLIVAKNFIIKIIK
ncbi:hypothetical protein HMI54_004864 [Coelomomyces lativittatus]|nr:hypothetical protein HMI56_001796 [Coelomomyces lativittatus]KAJ1506924.1 hypothetical protein HMI55_000979 [Coelomomyces lativittatus]KAJ1517646.1 hypothetical protein HMI54_004864 [Coelomomyces lativittatus]